MLTPEQKVVLVAYIATVPAINTLYVDGNLDGLAFALNTDHSPDFWVWRTAVEKKEVVESVSRGGTSFIWAANGFIGRSNGELECWNQLFNSILMMNPSLPNVRQAFADIFSGTGNAALNRTHLDIVGRRKASVIEKVFATGSGLDTTAGAGLLTYEGPVPYTDFISM
jgi:hypothetical protein